MIKRITCFLIIGACFSFHAKRVKKIIPPGTVQIAGDLFADETEVSNFAWQEYESWIKAKFGNGSKEYQQVLPDTLVWQQKISTNAPYIKYYYRHPAYKNYPVVGVSYEQVIRYCKWRTERVKEYYFKNYKKEINLEYRLPGKEEWEMISTNGATVFANEGKNKNGEIMFNHRWMTDSVSANYFKEHNQYPDVTAAVYSYSRNSFGLYCSFGNVAEMISEKGISKGGSWLNSLEECRAEKEISYSVPTAWLGFRCVCNLKEAS